MKDRLLTFIDALRAEGISISVAEMLDAMHVVGAVGIAPEAFHHGLTAALVKDEADRPAFDALFARFFALARRTRGKSEPPRAAEVGEGRGTGRQHTHPPLGGSLQRPEHEPAQRGGPEPHGNRQREQRGGERLARMRALLDLRFDQMSPSDIEACEDLVADLAQRFRAHLRRRQRVARRGRFDIRRTLRRSIGTGGTPIDPTFRHRRPGRPDLIALCDLSHSVASVSKFLLALLAPASAHFRRARLFAYVDRIVEVSFEASILIPHSPLDLYARSDFGKTLAGFCEIYEPLLTRSTVVLILGDGRNNRRPPRGDLLGRIHAAVRQVVWLNPESPARWNTGDSAMATYQRHCDAVLAASNIRELHLALQRTFRALIR